MSSAPAFRPAQGFIFDMDGVLADTEPIYRERSRSLFAQLGIDLPPEAGATFAGMSPTLMWTVLKDRFRLTDPVSVLAANEADHFFRHVSALPHLSPIDGIPELLSACRDRGLPLALASSAFRRNIDLVLDRTGLAGFFPVRVSGEDIRHGKPDPDGFLEAARRLGLPPAGLWVVEDSANGVRAAKAAGMTVVGFRNPASGAQDLSPADLHIDDFGPVIRKRLLDGLAAPA